MKALLKNLALKMLGKRRTYALRRVLRGPSKIFSEIELIETYFRKRKTPGFMIDVGAHHGESLEAYQNYDWHVLAFEPDLANRVVLEQRVDSRFVEILPVAVSDREDDGVAFYSSFESDGISSLSAFRGTHRESARVRVTTLTAVMKERQITRVDYLKIDTEGHDLFVLKGFPWQQSSPEVVTCEFEDSKTIPLGYDYRQMGDFLMARGYQVFLSEWAPIVRYGGAHTWRNWRAYPCTMANLAGWGNFVAFKPGSDLRAVDNYLCSFAKT